MTAACFLWTALAVGSVGVSSDLTYIGTWTTGLSYPARVAPAPGEGAYVPDPPMKQALRFDADGADNLRVQVFDTTGILLFRFGYRTLYLPTTTVAWVAMAAVVVLEDSL